MVKDSGYWFGRHPFGSRVGGVFVVEGGLSCCSLMFAISESGFLAEALAPTW